MRNYSEIGCLTLLGVTLTVYVAVGANCHTQTSMPELSRKNIEAEPFFDGQGQTFKGMGGTHYFVKLTKASNQSSSPFSTDNLAAAISLPEVIPGPVVPELPVSASGFFNWLPGFQRAGQGPISLGFTYNVFSYNNPLLHFAGEIRAGPMA